MWLYRRILRISWVNKVTNKAVLEGIKKDLEVMRTIKRRKLEYLEHIMRNENHYRLLKSILQGKLYSKREPGRISWLRNLRKCFSKNTTDYSKQLWTKWLYPGWSPSEDDRLKLYSTRDHVTMSSDQLNVNLLHCSLNQLSQ